MVEALELSITTPCSQTAQSEIPQPFAEALKADACVCKTNLREGIAARRPGSRSHAAIRGSTMGQDTPEPCDARRLSRGLCYGGGGVARWC